MKMRRLLVILALLVVLCLASGGFALDLKPPQWRGQPDSTYAVWEFMTPDIRPVPDIEVNPFGYSDMTVYPAHSWMQAWGGRFGVWPLSGAIEIGIPNNPVGNEFKLIQIQLTWAAEYPVPTQPVVIIEATGVDGQAIPLQDIKLIGQSVTTLGPTNEPVGGNWYHSTYLFEIRPNPVFENIYISGSLMVDELVVDTICIPEPATFALLGLGCLIFITRKRKHT